MAQLDSPSRLSSAVQTAAPNVYRVPTGISNAYFVALDADEYVVVDVGDYNHASKILETADELFDGKPPKAIVLTHCHFDHAGALPEVLAAWQNVPVYAHPLDLPYVNEGKRYPPGDPTTGGVMAQMSRFMDTARPTDSPRKVQPLGEGAEAISFMPGWELRPTPGHTPGHVSLWNASTRTLIAGDAVITLKQDSLVAVLMQSPIISTPPPYATYNWHHARQSARALAELEPYYLCTGHGVPMQGADIAERLKEFVVEFPVPTHGRYVATAAKFNREGPVFIPPPAPDYAKQIAIVAGVAGLAVGAYLLLRPKKRDEVV